MGTDDVDVINLTRYFHHVHGGVEEILKLQHAPLVLGCVEYLAPLYKEVSTYRHILETIIAGSPDGVKNEASSQSVGDCGAAFRTSKSHAAAQYHEGVAKDRASHSLADILAAAHQGRVVTLFVPLGVRRWGRFNLETFALEEHNQEQSGNDELLDLATMQTLMHAGTVYAVSPDEVPAKRLLAAVFRFLSSAAKRGIPAREAVQSIRVNGVPIQACDKRRQRWIYRSKDDTWTSRLS